MAEFLRIDHLTITTADLEDAAQVWGNTLGLWSEEAYEPPGTGLRLARLPVGDAFVQLATPTSETGPFAQNVRIRGEGLFALAIEVDDLEAAVAHLRAAGAEVSDPTDRLRPGARIARIRPASTHGVLIRLVQRS